MHTGRLDGRGVPVSIEEAVAEQLAARRAQTGPVAATHADEALVHYQQRAAGDGWPLDADAYFAAAWIAQRADDAAATELTPEAFADADPVLAGWAWRLVQEVYVQLPDDDELRAWVVDAVTQRADRDPRHAIPDLVDDLCGAEGPEPALAVIRPLGHVDEQLAATIHGRAVSIARAVLRPGAEEDERAFDGLFARGELAACLWTIVRQEGIRPVSSGRGTLQLRSDGLRFLPA